ncbi:nuclease (plasmid) [Agrobacterium leguminum]|uniref:thermonuclease family protein n=1 Tax=Agrobacterium leguminum TaxID=2792015 RepID=UPI0010C95F79|nr:nuclease [Agrobacterium leguminum]WFS69587.1 nuclease [Agrobacterium leguminum]
MDTKARRPPPFLLLTLTGALFAAQAVAQDAAAAKFVTYYQSAFAQGRDLIPAPQAGLNIASIATDLRLETVKPVSALTGNSFLDASSDVVKLVGIQGCLSTEQLDFMGNKASCTMISLAGMTASLKQAQADAGDAFPCHFVGQNSGRPNVRFAECFFTENDIVQSLSETMIRKGVVFAARDRAGRPIFPEYAKAEDEARLAKTGIWANPYFKHPYGERYRANPTN